MDQAGGAGVTAPSAGPENTAVLTVKESFESILDVPFVNVVKINGQCQAEVWLSGDEIYDRLRISRADQAAAEHGQKSYATRHGAYGNMTIHYSEYPSGGA